MDRSKISLLLASVTLLVISCTTNDPGSTDQDGGQDGATSACDPAVQEYQELMVDYEASLAEMIASGKADKTQQDAWTKRMKEVVGRIRTMGETGLGPACWTEFQAEARTRGPRVAELHRKLVKMRLHEEGVDTTALGQPRVQ